MLNISFAMNVVAIIVLVALFVYCLVKTMNSDGNENARMRIGAVVTFLLGAGLIVYLINNLG